MRLVWVELDGSTKTGKAGDRHDQETAFWHDARKVLQIDRDKLGVRETLRQTVKSGFERANMNAIAACAFREDNDRGAVFHRLDDRQKRVPILFALAVDQDRLQTLFGNEAVNLRAVPIILGGNRSDIAPNIARQGRQQGWSIKMRGMIGEIDTLRR